MDRNHNSSRDIYPFTTFVADTEQMKKVISSVVDIVIQQLVKRNTGGV
jgi:hypothetical protein